MTKAYSDASTKVVPTATMVANDRCQRWDHRKAVYRPSRETIDTGNYHACPIDEQVAKDFIQLHHYSGSYPASMIRIGLWEKQPFHKDNLVGVAIFGPSANQHVIPHWTGQAASDGTTLSRFCLLDSVPANGETFFLGKCFRFLRELKPGLRTVIAYADPIARRNRSGQLVKPGHVGIIYQAFNGRFLGQSRARTLLLDPDGQVISERALSKLRRDECGRDYVLDSLVRSGAPTPRLGESGEAYVNRVLAGDWLRPRRHSGNYVYAWPVGCRQQRRVVGVGFPGFLPYPKPNNSNDHLNQEE